MSTSDDRSSEPDGKADVGSVDMKLEVVVPVSEVDRAKAFYAEYMVAEQAATEPFK